MNVAYAPQALRGIDGILAYMHARNPRDARNVSLAIERTIELCALNPDIGASTDEPNLYRYPLARYRYAIFYRVDATRGRHRDRARDPRRACQEPASLARVGLLTGLTRTTAMRPTAVNECANRVPSLAVYIAASQDGPECWVWQRSADGCFAADPVIVAGRQSRIEVPALGIAIALGEVYRGSGGE